MAQNVTRKNSPSIRVHCLPQEKLNIETLAKNCNLSAAALLRNLAAGYQPKSILDANVAIELIKISGDLGRLGGLLKMFLTDDERLNLAGKDQTKMFIHGLLQDIKATQTLLFETAKKV